MDVTVNDITNPVANAGMNQTVNQGAFVAFNGGDSGDNLGITNYTWTFIEGKLQTLYEVNPTYTFNIAGVFVLTLRVTDAAGNWDIDTKTVTVKDIADPVADAGSDKSILQNAEVTFDGSSSYDNIGIVNYTWRFIYDGNEVFLYGPTPIFKFDKAGNFRITLTVRDAIGNIGTDKVNITVLAKGVEEDDDDTTGDDGTENDDDTTGDDDTEDDDDTTGDDDTEDDDGTTGDDDIEDDDDDAEGGNTTTSGENEEGGLFSFSPANFVIIGLLVIVIIIGFFIMLKKKDRRKESDTPKGEPAIIKKMKREDAEDKSKKKGPLRKTQVKEPDDWSDLKEEEAKDVEEIGKKEDFASLENIEQERRVKSESKEEKQKKKSDDLSQLKDEGESDDWSDIKGVRKSEVSDGLSDNDDDWSDIKRGIEDKEEREFDEGGGE